jgi:hypothetical protein
MGGVAVKEGVQGIGRVASTAQGKERGRRGGRGRGGENNRSSSESRCGPFSWKLLAGLVVVPRGGSSKANKESFHHECDG